MFPALTRVEVPELSDVDCEIITDKCVRWLESIYNQYGPGRHYAVQVLRVVGMGSQVRASIRVTHFVVHCPCLWDIECNVEDDVETTIESTGDLADYAVFEAAIWLAVARTNMSIRMVAFIPTNSSRVWCSTHVVISKSSQVRVLRITWSTADMSLLLSTIELLLSGGRIHGIRLEVRKTTDMCAVAKLLRAYPSVRHLEYKEDRVSMLSYLVYKEFAAIESLRELNIDEPLPFGVYEESLRTLLPRGSALRKLRFGLDPPHELGTPVVMEALVDTIGGAPYLRQLDFIDDSMSRDEQETIRRLAPSLFGGDVMTHSDVYFTARGAEQLDGYIRTVPAWQRPHVFYRGARDVLRVLAALSLDTQPPNAAQQLPLELLGYLADSVLLYEPHDGRRYTFGFCVDRVLPCCVDF